jgi:hypothetical protein
MRRNPLESFACPRCGDIGSLTTKAVNGRSYFYMKHYLGKDENGRSKYKYCYLGPVDEYLYVSKTTHPREAIPLTNMANLVRDLEYLIALSNFVSQNASALTNAIKRSKRFQLIDETIKAVEETLQTLKMLSEMFEEEKIVEEI